MVMESNGLPGGVFPGTGSGMLGLEMSLRHHHRQPPQQNTNHLQHHQHQPVVAFGHHESDHHSQHQQTVKQGYPFARKSRTQQLTFSDDDEPGPAAEDSAGDGNRKISPWHRMKWTDGMVRLLIMVVFYIGDDQLGSEGNDQAARKKGGVGGGVLQKKGKWKSVSRAMMEKGFFVSPQQCEDKFNDLNKRYKRVNDILGKGTACRVVENQSLLETMDHLSSKMKEEVKKLLNSKHLFFREMCAYHNSCGGVANGGDAQQSAEVAAESSQIQQQSQQKRCLHLPENASNVPNLTIAETKGSKMLKGGNGEEEDDDDEEEYEDDEEVVEGGAHDSHECDTDDKTSTKKPRKEMFDLVSPLIEEFSTELKNVEQDGSKSLWEKRRWMRMRLIQLEEQRMSYRCQAFELEKARIKWLKFSSNKEREIEIEKLGNERMRLENEKMVLLLRQKELELLGLQQQNQSSYKRGDPSSIAV